MISHASRSTAHVLPLMELAERAVELDPDSVFHLKNLGAVLYRSGRFDEALAKLNEAELRHNDPKHDGNSSPAYTWYFLAMTHQRLGHEDEARKWYEKGYSRLGI
jgi:tetratricopeptide (TPR) repeat protein